jgi:hypothetical protein
MKICSLLLFVILLVSCSCWTDCVRAAQLDTSTKGTETRTETQRCQAEGGGTSASAVNDGACSAVDTPVERKTSVEGNRTYPECGLYIAESTIPNAGLGIFTAQAKKPMDPLGSGDVCIPNIDIKYHGHVFDPFADYYWSAFSLGMTRESHANDMDAYCPGIDSSANSNLALINTQKSAPLYDNAGLHRFNDSGVGAFTPYQNVTSYASRHIPAGGELFKYYGDSWFKTRPQMFEGNLPLLNDYPMAEELLRNMTAMKLGPSIQKDLYENIVVGMKKAFTSRVLGALPLTIQDAITAAEQEIAVLHQPFAMRSVAWLHENGRCVDNMEPRYSTIRQAGRGAFATRPLAAGQVITTSPLHHLPRSRFVEMYNFNVTTNAQGEWVRIPVSVSGYRVLVNYCFGNKNSGMLLCPYGNGVNYINHNQSQTNVKIRWAQDFGIVHNATLVEKGLVQDLLMRQEYKPQLAFDYMALRDIQQGEELFLDYGDSYEAAWHRHVANYKPPPHSENFMDGMSINIKYHSAPIRTEQEQQSNPYPEHLQIRGHVGLETIPDSKNDGISYTWASTDYGLPVRILERHVTSTEHTYTLKVGLIPKEVFMDKHTRDREANLTWVRRERVPRHAILFFDKPGYTDMHLPGAFRQPILIPDDIFPAQWSSS